MNNLPTTGGGFWNFVGDPAGYVTGTNTEGFGGVKKMLFGDPSAIKKAYDDMISTATKMTGDTRNFLGGQENKALEFYSPVNHFLQSAYGTEGLQAPQIPKAPGMSDLAGMYPGGK